MTSNGFDTLDANHFGSGLARLHELIIRSRGRVEVTREGCGEKCVIISKTELDSLEEALSILSQTEDFQSMHAKLNQIAEAHGPASPL